GKGQSLGRVLSGLGIPHVGNRAAQVLAEEFGNIKELMAADVERLEQINEIGPIMAQSIFRFCDDKRTRSIIEDLINVGLEMPGPKKAEKKEGILTGKTIVVTGSVEGHTRGQMEELVATHGGKATGSISKKTDMVVYGENPGSKLAKAEKLGVDTMTADEFLEML
ncbi:MAG: hypothetical protein KAJ52_06510, partial [Sedimentisphaerales bacterium]|nr:hypothetical protein [Sedimentisphaerales bacterium]